MEIALPPGFFGEPNATPRCTREQLDAGACPADTQIGELVPLIDPTGGGPGSSKGEALYNMVPPPGMPAQFGFAIFGVHAFIDVDAQGYGSSRWSRT